MGPLSEFSPGTSGYGDPDLRNAPHPLKSLCHTNVHPPFHIKITSRFIRFKGIGLELTISGHIIDALSEQYEKRRVAIEFGIQIKDHQSCGLDKGVETRQ